MGVVLKGAFMGLGACASHNFINSITHWIFPLFETYKNKPVKFAGIFPMKILHPVLIEQGANISEIKIPFAGTCESHTQFNSIVYQQSDAMI